LVTNIKSIHDARSEKHQVLRVQSIKFPNFQYHRKWQEHRMQ